MKKIRKHNFSHPDPEKTIVKTKLESKNGTRGESPEDSLTAKDLKRVLVSIVAFTVILISLYFLNRSFDLLQKFTELINF